jgi:hypothetical protein
MFMTPSLQVLMQLTFRSQTFEINRLWLRRFPLFQEFLQ